MANKSVPDFLATTSTDPADVLYLIRGTGSGRDKKITWANLTANLLDKTFTNPQTMVGQLLISTNNSDVLSLRRNSTTVNNGTLVCRQNYAQYSAGQIVDGFGVAEGFYIRDIDGVDNQIGMTRWLRNGADNTGKYAIQLASAGTLADRFTVDHTGTANASLKLQEAGVDISAKYAAITSGKPSGAITSITSTQTVDPVNGMTYVFNAAVGTTLTLSLAVADGTTCFVVYGSGAGTSDGYMRVAPLGSYAPSVWVYGKAGASGALQAPAMFIKYGTGSNPAYAGWSVVGGRNGVAS